MSEAPPDSLLRGGLSVSPQQAAVVDHAAAHALTVVDAGAGSGKTQTTVATVLHLLETQPALSIDRFVLITFTLAAAAELRDRLDKSLIEQAARVSSMEARARWSETRERLPNAFLGTIHGFCRLILRSFGYGSLVAREADVEFSRTLEREAVTDAVEETFAADPEHVLREGLGTRWQTYQLETLVREILTHVRNRGIFPAQVALETAAQADDPGQARRVAVANLVARAGELYASRKKEDQKVDATDLLQRTAETLESAEGPPIAAKLGVRYRYLFVDEFQDTDEVQMRIVDALRGQLAAVLLVGDDKQSIYLFRGAGMRLGEIARQRGTVALPLSLSRRPTRNLLELQNALFHKVGERYPELRNLLGPAPNTVTSQSPLPAMVYAHAGDADDQAAGIAATAGEIRRILQGELDHEGGLRPAAPGDVVLLFRSNRKLDAYARELPALLGPGIPVRKEAGGQFFRRSEILGAYRVLRLLTDPQNDLVLAQALETPYLAVECSGILRGLLRSGSVEPLEFTHWFEENHRDLAGRLRDLRAEVRIETVPELLELLYRAFGMREFHRARGESLALANLEKLREQARNLTRNRQALTLPMFVSWLQLRLMHGYDEPDALDSATRENRPPHVRLMTVHKAKGAEFPVVIIPEVQSPVIGYSGEVDFVVHPGWGLDVKLPLATPTESRRFVGLTRRDEHSERAEALRIFYVAVTRAQSCVVFVGAGPREVHQPHDHRYSWKDEIRRAWPALAQLGAEFRTANVDCAVMRNTETE
jgi:DNA helicase-2/ATP-dependent DNA helicase PcrA